jgi:hypothetical protein
MHSLQSHGHDGSTFWLPSHAGQTNAADEWAWSPLRVSGASCGPDDEEAKAFSMTQMILGMGFEWLLQLPMWYR